MLEEAIVHAFRETLDRLYADSETTPIDRWNESVFRYFFCSEIAKAGSQITQYVECELIDLVLATDRQRAFVEFKFYRHAPKFGAYDGLPRGYKGAAGPRNLGEFQKCITDLHRRPIKDGVLKYVVLVYADPDQSRRTRFSESYDAYEHPPGDIKLRRVVATQPRTTTQGTIKGAVYQVLGGAVPTNPKEAPSGFAP